MFYPNVKQLTFLIIPVVAFAQGLYQHSHSGELTSHSRYTLSYMETHEQAEWVYYNLNSTLANGNIERSNNFKEDYSVSTGSAKPSDYKYSGYDRGHLAPAGDMKSSYTAMSESFYMSNISPQNPSFNRGGWKKLESLIRGWANTSEIHIVTAGILTGELTKIGSTGVSVPKYFYKIIYAPKEAKMIGFVMPNSKISMGLSSYVKSVDEIESLTGIDFFYDLDDFLENKLESKSDITLWDFSVSSTTPISSTSTALQCKGIAKTSGNRCRNKTKNEIQYCYAHQSQSNDYTPPAKTNYVGRCNANTKSGSRCKRNASSGSRYCWQHK